MIVCIIGFLIGLPFIMNGGFYLFDLVDSVSTTISLFIVLLLSAFITTKYIGIDVLKELIANKTGKVIPNYVYFCLTYVCPIVLCILACLSIEDTVRFGLILSLSTEINTRYYGQ